LYCIPQDTAQVVRYPYFLFEKEDNSKMKVTLAFVLNMLLSTSCNGFTTTTTTTTTSSQRQMTILLATGKNNNNVVNTAAAILLGVVLTAAPLAGMAETSLDFSLPKYDAGMSGFGEGNEARLYDRREMTDPGGNEKEKQLESMRKAEDARKERIAKEKAVTKARDDEARQRAAEKKARDAERLKNIWAS
jgi:hypothetical protein